MTVIQWDQDTANGLRQKMNGIRQLEQLVAGFDDLLAEERREYFARLGRMVGKAPDSICVGAGSCDQSPIKACVYEYVADDVCLFCGQPNERK